MLSRISGIPLLLGAAVAVPYVVSNAPEGASSFWQSTGQQTNQDSADSETLRLPQQKVVDSAPRGPGAELYPVDTPLEGNHSISLEEVFRFDVSKEWVYEHWARKSTALSDLGLFGVRVPLVTGTQLYDVAGSLTYFFDQAGRIQRVSFRGHTGDTTRLVMLAVRRFGLQPQPAVVTGEQLYQLRNENGVISQLQTHPSAVLWSSSPHNSFDVEFDLQAPGTSTPLPSKVLPPLSQKPSEDRFAKEPVAGELTAEQEAAKTAAEQREKRRELEEKLNAFFPRSRVPQPQVKSLDQRDLYW